ncbi:uncharacterized protein LOC144343540 [Saccoglossus kowalevskii]
MGRYCEAALCWSHDNKRKNLQRYPWMRDVTWVKFPPKATMRATWKKLLRRQDKFEITVRSRLCSRHFDKEQLQSDGNAVGFPKYFSWNNYGLVLNPRKSGAVEKRAQADTAVASGTLPGASLEAKPDEIGEQPNEIPVFAGSRRAPTTCGPHIADSVGREVTVHLQTKKIHKNIVGRMHSIPENIPNPQDHDYISYHQASTSTKSTQTLLTAADICRLEVKSTTPSKTPVEDLIDSTILGSDERVNFYTGIQSKTMLQGLWSSVEKGAEKLRFWKGPARSRGTKNYEGTHRAKPGKQHSVSIFFQFILTLIRLRLDLPLLLLADLFCIGTTTVTEITVTWLAYLNQTIVPALVFWPSQATVRANMPSDFKMRFPSVCVIIDCTEFFMDRPANKEEQYKTFLQYKSHNTYKCLVGINPNGAFTFVSSLWGGNVSDRYLTEHCGLLDKLNEGDAVMADRGFHIEDSLLEKGAKLVAPPFTRKTTGGVGKRLNVNEIKTTRDIARFRIHVERAIQRLKTFRILKHQIPTSLNGVASIIVQVVAALCNLKGLLYYGTNELAKKRLHIKKKPLKRLLM